jgi:hypothetical protein
MVRAMTLLFTERPGRASARRAARPAPKRVRRVRTGLLALLSRFS